MKLIELKPGLYVNVKSIISIEIKKTEYKPEKDMVVVSFKGGECSLLFSDKDSAQKKVDQILSKISYTDVLWV